MTTGESKKAPCCGGSMKRITDGGDCLVCGSYTPDFDRQHQKPCGHPFREHHSLCDGCLTSAAERMAVAS